MNRSRKGIAQRSTNELLNSPTDPRGAAVHRLPTSGGSQQSRVPSVGRRGREPACIDGEVEATGAAVSYLYNNNDRYCRRCILAIESLHFWCHDAISMCLAIGTKARSQIDYSGSQNQFKCRTENEEGYATVETTTEIWTSVLNGIAIVCDPTRTPQGRTAGVSLRNPLCRGCFRAIGNDTRLLCNACYWIVYLSRGTCGCAG